MAETAFKEVPFSGHVFVFHNERRNLIKLLWFDGTERQERGRFVWPQAINGTVWSWTAQPWLTG
jgi:transposase